MALLLKLQQPRFRKEEFQTIEILYLREDTLFKCRGGSFQENLAMKKLDPLNPNRKRLAHHISGKKRKYKVV